MGKQTEKGGEIAIESLEAALKIVDKFSLPVLITMPVCKENIKNIRKQFIGQTEFIQQFFLAKNTFQGYISSNFFYALLTAHIPLYKVRNYITYQRVLEVITSINDFCSKFLRISNPKLAMLCVNPHCGEMLKHSDEEKIKNIITTLQQKFHIEGPYSFEASIKLFRERKIDCCIGIYHDQVIIPLKILTNMQLCEINLGIPILRIGPVHGSGFDIAKQFTADNTSTDFTFNMAFKLLETFLTSQMQLFYNKHNGDCR